ncbi:hypothetical protein ACJ5H2_05985 [Nocardioides sp. R1-1]|uniref:hypothetical protein n=1 Tax=Nocardioides sp. R1-1 TaxID=3383502 RepID=UPI0038CF7092
MADHYLKSVELLDEAEALRVELDALYDEPRKWDVQEQIGAKRAHLRDVLKRAEIHSNLAVAQATFERTVGL